MINNIDLVSTFVHKDKSNIFSNVLVKNGVMTAQNELTGISVSVNSSVDFCCNADRLRQSLKNCSKDNLKLTIKNDRLYILSCKFKSNIELLPVDSYPEITNDGDKIDIQSDIIHQLNSITQFTEPNDVRVALRGVAITDGFIKATNGHMAIKKITSNIDIDELIIPTKSIQTMFKAKTIINSITVKNNMVFFNFEDGYLFTKTIDQKMPDIDRILVEIKDKTEISIISDAIKAIAPMCSDSRTIVIGKSIETQKGDASIGVFNLKDSAFNVDYILKIIDVADYIDFSNYPGVCGFEGEGVKGVVAGIRL